MQLEHKPLENDDEEGHCNIHVAIKEQQEMNTVDSTRKRKKEKRTGSQRKKFIATNIDAQKLFFCSDYQTDNQLCCLKYFSNIIVNRTWPLRLFPFLKLYGI